MQAGVLRWVIYEVYLEKLEQYPPLYHYQPTPTHSQPRDKKWPNQATPVYFPIQLASHTDYQETKGSLTQVTIVKWKREVYDSFQGYIWKYYLLQDIILSVKIKSIIPIKLCLGGNVHGWLKGKKQRSSEINYHEIAQRDSVGD